MPHGANDASVAAIAVAETRADGIEKLVHGFVGHQVGSRLSARGEISALTEGDHLFDGGAQGLGFGNRGFDTLFDDERSHHIPQK